MPDTGRSNVRELRRIELPVGETGFGDPDGPLRVAVVVDVETTGLSPQEDKIIELAMRRFTYDPEGQIVEIGRLEQPVGRAAGLEPHQFRQRRIGSQLAAQALRVDRGSPCAHAELALAIPLASPAAQ